MVLSESLCHCTVTMIQTLEGVLKGRVVGRNPGPLTFPDFEQLLLPRFIFEKQKNRPILTDSVLFVVPDGTITIWSVL